MTVDNRKGMLGVYVRTSTRDQPYTSQLSDLETYAQAKGGLVTWYKDQFTGRTMRRPAFDELDMAIGTGAVTELVVWRLDRLGRTAAGLVAFLERLVACHCNLVSLRDGLDLSTPAGRLMANILASVAAFETEVRAERVAAGQAAAQARGTKWGGSEPGWHYKVTAAHRRVVKDLIDAGHNITDIAAATCLSRPTVYRLLDELGIRGRGRRSRGGL